jgi:hypothetical protein
MEAVKFIMISKELKLILHMLKGKSWFTNCCLSQAVVAIYKQSQQIKGFLSFQIVILLLIYFLIKQELMKIINSVLLYLLLRLDAIIYRQ